jgi:taurine dioxygenase
MTDTTTFAVRRLSDVAGAELTGVDLAEPLSPTLRDAIMAAFLEHRLLVFRDQRLTKDRQYDLTLHMTRHRRILRRTVVKGTVPF